LAPVIIFYVTQARNPRIAAKLGFSQSQKHSGTMLVNSFLKVRVHPNVELSREGQST
jgi:hypothetical protein